MAQNLWKSSRLVYRAVEHSDEPFLALLNTNSLSLVNAASMLPLPQNSTNIVGFREFIEKQLVGVLICLPDETSEGSEKPKPIGEIHLTQIKPGHHRNAMVGINILAEYQGKGYGSEAIKWITEFGFMTVGLHRVEIGSFECNESASRLYERLGFVREGFKREAIWSQGRWWGETLMSMLEGEWRALREKGAM